MHDAKYICNNDKYTYNKGYISLPLKIENLPEEILINEIVLQKKTSFHVSLLCVKNILEKQPDLEERTLDFFCAFVSQNEISFIKYAGEFRFAQDEDRKSLVALCEISNLKTLSDSLSKELGIEIPPQPTHVTLYTLQPDLGIGLNSTSEVEERSVLVSAPENVRASLGLN